MKKNDRGYALLISMVALVLLTTLSGLLVLSSQSESRRSRTTRSDLQAHYIAEEGLANALDWFDGGTYSLPSAGLVNLAPGTPPSYTDPMGGVYSASVSTAGGAAIVMNATASGTATTHPTTYTSV